MTSTKIQCIAVISATNAPLYLRCFSAKDDSRQANLRYQFIAHSALDIVEERIAPGKGLDQYLGLLLTLEDVAVYGFQTSTRVKFMVMVGISDAVVKDLDIITIFRAIHTSYLSHLCNPFHSISPALLSRAASSAPLPPSEANLLANRRPIHSPLFERRMEKIVGWTRPGSSTAGAPPPVSKDPAPAPGVKA